MKPNLTNPMALVVSSIPRQSENIKSKEEIKKVEAPIIIEDASLNYSIMDILSKKR